MDIKKSLRGDVFFPVKKNFQFLREQGKTFLKEAYLLGLFIRLFVLFYYTKAGMYAFSQPLLTAGWTEVPALMAGGVVALLLSVIAILALRHWLSAAVYLAVAALIFTFLQLSIYSEVHFELFKLFLMSNLFTQALYLAPLFFLQFSWFKTSALTKETVRTVTNEPVSHLGTGTLQDPLMEMQLGVGHHGEPYFDMVSPTANR